MHRRKCVCAALFALSVFGFEARAATSCTAGNPNTTSVIEATPSGAFVNNNDATVSHALTGLMWKRCAQGLSGAACEVGTATRLDWKDSLKAAATDTTAGYDDWRLPNMKELDSILETCGYEPAINQVIFPATPIWSFFWTGSTDAYESSARAWGVEFGTGYDMLEDKTNTHLVRLVRGGRTYGTFDARLALRCNLDIDGNGQVDALTDGLIFVRALFGLTGTSVTNGALGVGATRTDWVNLRTFMNDRCGTDFAP